jgi:hypothetical protein
MNKPSPTPISARTFLARKNSSVLRYIKALASLRSAIRRQLKRLKGKIRRDTFEHVESRLSRIANADFGSCDARMLRRQAVTRRKGGGCTDSGTTTNRRVAHVYDCAANAIDKYKEATR